MAPGCSRSRDQNGQIFVVTAGRENLKMGLVGVHILTDEQLKAIATPLISATNRPPTGSPSTRPSAGGTARDWNDSDWRSKA